MTTIPDQIQRDALLALPIAGLIGLVAGGSIIAVEAVFCAVIAALNLQVYRWLVTRVSDSVVSGEDGGIPAVLLSMKLGATLAVVVVLMQFLSPVSIVVGLATTLGVTAFTGTVRSLRAPEVVS